MSGTVMSFRSLSEGWRSVGGKPCVCCGEGASRRTLRLRLYQNLSSMSQTSYGAISTVVSSP
jgi:hypothetical protein